MPGDETVDLLYRLRLAATAAAQVRRLLRKAAERIGDIDVAVGSVVALEDVTRVAIAADALRSMAARLEAAAASAGRAAQEALARAERDVTIALDHRSRAGNGAGVHDATAGAARPSSG